MAENLISESFTPEQRERLGARYDNQALWLLDRLGLIGQRRLGVVGRASA